MPTNQGGSRIGNAFRGAGRFIGERARDTPIGQLLTGGGIRGAWNATPIMRLVHAIQGGGSGSTVRATPSGAFGPMAGNYMGLPQGQPQASPGLPSNFGGTDWSQFIAPDPNMGPPQYSAPMVGMGGPSGGNQPGRAAYTGVGSAPGGLLGVLGSGNGATGANRIGMMANNPVKQSGIYFVDQTEAR